MKLRQYFMAGALALGMSFGTMAAPVTAFADTIVVKADDDGYSDAMTQGEQIFSQDMATSATTWGAGLNLYRDDTKEKVTAEDCFEESDDGGYTLSDDYKHLDETSKQAFIDAAKDYSEYYAGTEQDNFDASTAVSDWWSRVVATDGVGANYVASLTKGLKADLTAGYSVFKPLQSIINTILGAGAIIIIAFLLVSILIDLFYITLPPVRMAMDNSGKKNHDTNYGRNTTSHTSTSGPSYVSAAAREAVHAEESGENGLWVYLKKSIIKIIVLALCLVLLISGQVFTFVGWVLNLVADMFGLSF
jgi:hypothetical protein